ncbi:MAG: cytidylate kinase-like family protein [Chloroflexi bacterium]|nr:cytidylate kinase-like family protein [Chloroflexota bacterium]
MAIVTIGGLTGSGGRQLGQLVAEKLDADYVDRLILTRAAKQAGATVEALHQREQRPPTTGERFSRFLQRVLERSAMSGAGADPYFGPGAMAFLTQEYEDVPQPTITRGHELEDDKYIAVMRDVVKNLAESGNVVVVGRGGAIILKDMPNVLRIGVAATPKDRVARIVEREKVKEEDAKKIVTDRDRARAFYFKRFFGIENSSDPNLYHMSLNTSQMTLDYAAEAIIAAAKALEEGRFLIKTPAKA